VSKLNILIVEDNATDADLAIRELRRAGIDCDTILVDNEFGLRQALDRSAPDIVLSDFTLPGFSGPAALNIVREKCPETPFVFLSGTIGEERAIEAIKQGATDYVLKDSPARLGTAVERALQEADSRRRRRSAEHALHETKERLDSILGLLTDVVWSASPDRASLLYVNQCAESVYGYKLAQLYADPSLLFRCIHSEDRERVDAHWAAAVDNKRFDLEYRIIRPDGVLRCVHHRGWSVRGDDGRVWRIDGIIRDVTERRRYEAQIEYLATHDGLTDLPNRNLLNDRLGQMIARAARTEARFAVLFLDVDRFKFVNDSFGHLVGDKVLKAVAARLRGVVRTGDTVARLGGDEFVVVVSDLAAAADAEAFTNKLLTEVFAVPFLVDGRKHSIEASVGVALYPGDGTTPDILLRNADAAMYRAKERGRDCVQFYTSELAAQTRQRVELEQALRLALEKRQFVLTYQPQVDLRSGRISGVEALIRWHHSDVDVVMPARFIPLAEQTGLILPIGEWVLRTACMQAHKWHRSGHPDLSIAVNVSACQLQQQSIIELVRRVLAETGLDPGRLEIELTETTLLQTSDAVARSLQQLKSMGVKLSLDDFGTGYSSLVHVKYFPIDTIKIDQSFIHDLSCGVDDTSIVKAIIAMAHSLGMRTVAEGVESEAQLEFLRANRCDAIQGHYYSPSLSAEALTALLEAPRGL
jgi:diguanylate cyclase (GGDEF)-like protein/PAS domain S-box-containing protein